MRSVRRDLFCGDAEKGEAASRQLAKVVSWALPAEEVLPFLCSLVGQVGAVSPDCDRGALLWFEVAVQHWRMEPGDELRQVRDSVQTLWTTTSTGAFRPDVPPALSRPPLQVRSLVGALCSRMEICEGPDPLRCLTGGLCVLVERFPGPACLSLLQWKGLPGRAFLTCSGDPFLDGLLCRFLPPLNQPSGIFRDLSLSFCIELTEHLMEHRPEVVTPLLQGWLREAKEGGLTPHATAFQGVENVAEATAMAEVKTDPVVLESLLAELPHYLSSPLEEVQLEACKLAGILLENMDTLCSETLDLEPLSQGLRALTRDPGLGPALTAAAEEVQSRCLDRQASSRRRSPGFLRRFFMWQRKGRQRGGARP
nr:PREDICTED: uncharacterized protein LOC103281965 [Anolis carolinensis]|eukprot:XP_016854512.1 PREDICTED: uncharacterized protein LOC103281965 [Anolis carolinensis]